MATFSGTLGKWVGFHSFETNLNTSYEHILIRMTESPQIRFLPIHFSEKANLH